MPKGGILGAKMEPKSIPKRFKIEVDFQERGNTLQDRLGTVLEPSWADLGPFWVPSSGPNVRSRTRGLVFGENSCF